MKTTIYTLCAMFAMHSITWADMPSAKAIEQFQESAAKVDDAIKSNRIPERPSPPHTLTYDIKKTESLIQPAVGILVLRRNGILPSEEVAELVFDHGCWKISKMTFLVGESHGTITPNDWIWKTIQSYFGC